MIVFDCGFSTWVTCMFLLLEVIKAEIIRIKHFSFKLSKTILSWSDKSVKGTVVIRALKSLHEGSL